MGDILAYYLSVFDADSMYGYRHIISLFSAVILIWMLGLSYLVFKANPKGLENRFMAILLICEGFKASWLVVDFFPSGSEYKELWSYLWFIKTEFIFFASITSVLLYFSFPVYYRVNKLKFLYKEKYQKHVWYIVPILGLLIWMLLRVQDGFRFDNAAWLVCDGTTTYPVLESWWGGITETMNSTKDAVGTCSNEFNILIVDEPQGLWVIALSQAPVSIIALLLFRSAMKDSLREKTLEKKNSLTNRSLYIGFLGKVIIGMIYTLTLVALLPLLNGGEFVTFAQNIKFQFGADATVLDRIKLFLWTTSLSLPAIGIGFEALMFVHATLKDTAFGIDQNLRKTFTNTMFAGLGATLFIICSELVENFLGFGLLGGVVLGIGLFMVRKPVIGAIYGFSNYLIPSEFNQQEIEYLKLFEKSIKDGKITDNERMLLDSLTAAYGISEHRIAEIENSFLVKLSDNESE